VNGYALFSQNGAPPRIGAATDEGVVPLDSAGGRLAGGSLGPLLAAGRSEWARAYEAARRLVERGPDPVPLADVRLHVPFEVADYVDFYSSVEHATNLGRLFRPQGEPLLPNWRHLPVGYHGRAGTLVPSGTPIVRPCGQRKPPDADAPVFGPSRRLDIELELAFVVGTPSELGTPVPADRFRDHVFGVVLVNDWSARDVQAWEYQPLGPFLGKSFATSVGAWVTPLDALDDAWVAGPRQEPEPLPYLRVDGAWNLDAELQVELNGQVVSRTNARALYWSMPQQLAHATVNGTSLRAGDLFASGTISGAEPGSEGSLIELTWNGERPLELADGTQRTFLEDGDEVVLRGRGPGFELGEVRGRILPARA
jgi:fumarylacetoacetase